MGAGAAYRWKRIRRRRVRAIQVVEMEFCPEVTVSKTNAEKMLTLGNLVPYDCGEACEGTLGGRSRALVDLRVDMFLSCLTCLSTKFTFMSSIPGVS